MSYAVISTVPHLRSLYDEGVEYWIQCEVWRRSLSFRERLLQQARIDEHAGKRVDWDAIYATLGIDGYASDESFSNVFEGNEE